MANVITYGTFDLFHVGRLGVRSCPAAGGDKVLKMRADGGGNMRIEIRVCVGMN